MEKVRQSYGLKPMPKFFLAKTEPTTYSIDDLQIDKTTLWDGVHNFQALNVIKTWKPGDYVFIYHSVKDRAIAGLARIETLPTPNYNDIRPSFVAKIKFVAKFENQDIVTLDEIKTTGKFNDFLLVRHSRLSVMECPTNFVNWMKERVQAFKSIKV